MLFDFDLTVTAGTLQSNPVTAKARLAKGLLTQIRVIFPPGPATLVYVVVKDRLFQLLPINPDGNLNLDDAIVVTDLEYDIKDDPFTLDLVGWSPDAIFDHKITIQFEMQPAKNDSWSSFTQQLQQLISLSNG